MFLSCFVSFLLLQHVRDRGLELGLIEQRKEERTDLNYEQENLSSGYRNKAEDDSERQEIEIYEQSEIYWKRNLLCDRNGLMPNADPFAY